jgi:TPR repeat protein
MLLFTVFFGALISWPFFAMGRAAKRRVIEMWPNMRSARLALIGGLIGLSTVHGLVYFMLGYAFESRKVDPYGYTEITYALISPLMFGFGLTLGGLGWFSGSKIGRIMDLRAVERLRFAAIQGNVNAQLSLGSLYESGRGATTDFAEAAKWYQLPANQGDAVGQFKLGSMYENARGVKQNDAEALKWYRLAADLGNAEAKRILRALVKDTKPSQVTKAQRLAREWTAAHPKK